MTAIFTLIAVIVASIIIGIASRKPTEYRGRVYRAFSLILALAGADVGVVAWWERRSGRPF